jgi:hypothetical protein
VGEDMIEKADATFFDNFGKWFAAGQPKFSNQVRDRVKVRNRVRDRVRARVRAMLVKD